MIAIDAAYHKQCLTHFRNRYQIHINLKTYLGSRNPVQLYRSKQLGGNMSERTHHATRLKEKLLTQIPGLETHKGKYEIMLAFK